MSDHEAHDDYLARIATDIMYSDKYIDLLGSIYSERDSIAEFEINPKHYLMRHGIHIPDDIDVVLHYPGALGQLGRVDFHWGEPVRTALSNMRAAREKFRELARMASETLHSREMKQLRQTVQASPEALKEFASNPKGYAKAHGVVIPDELELKVELDDGDEPPRVDIHFDAPTGITMLRAHGLVPQDGCCYCKNGCCDYWTNSWPI